MSTTTLGVLRLPKESCISKARTRFSFATAQLYEDLGVTSLRAKITRFVMRKLGDAKPLQEFLRENLTYPACVASSSGNVIKTCFRAAVGAAQANSWQSLTNLTKMIYVHSYLELSQQTGILLFPVVYGNYQ